MMQQQQQLGKKDARRQSLLNSSQARIYHILSGPSPSTLSSSLAIAPMGTTYCLTPPGSPVCTLAFTTPRHEVSAFRRFGISAHLLVRTRHLFNLRLLSINSLLCLRFAFSSVDVYFSHISSIFKRQHRRSVLRKSCVRRMLVCACIQLTYRFI